MKIICLYILLGIFILPSHGFSALFEKQCTNRYEFRHDVPHIFPYLRNCTYVRHMHPICGKNIVISYAEHAPYVTFNHTTGRPVGFLPGMLRLAMETCCYGCANLTFIGPFKAVDKFFQNASILMPVESASNSKKFVGMEYVSFVDVPGVSFLARESSGRTTKLTKHLFKSVINTWPLFLTAFLMAIIAGCVVWVLDTWFNRYEFPSSFPRGPFEGFWWAFVSMTTVGYGDRAPKSIIARLFAVLWILLGITIFSMYTATLTSALSANVEALMKEQIIGTRVAVLNTTAAGRSAVVQEGAEDKGYGNIREIMTALLSGKVQSIAIDDNIATYHMKYLKAQLPDIREHRHVNIKHNSYGITTTDKELAEFVRSFFVNNEDHRATLQSHIMNHYGLRFHKAEGNQVDTTQFFSADSPIFVATIVALLVLGIVTIILGLTCKWYFKQHESILRKCIKIQDKKAKYKEPDVELKPIINQTGNLNEEFFKELEELKAKWMERLQSETVNGNGKAH